MRDIGKFNIIVAGVILSYLFDANESMGLLYWMGLGAGVCLLVSILVVPCKLVIYPIIIMLVLAPDVTQSALDIRYWGAMKSATVWQLNIGPISPSLIICSIIGFTIFRLQSMRISKWDRKLIVYFTIVPLIAGILYGYPEYNLSRMFTDAKLPIGLGLGLVLFSSYYANYPKEYHRSILFLIIIAIARFTTDFAYLFFGVIKTHITQNVSRVSVDSGKALIVVLIFALLTQAVLGRRKTMPLLLIVPMALLMIAYQTRLIVLCFLIGLIIFFLLENKIKIALLVLFFTTAFILFWPLMSFHFSDPFRILAGRFGSLVFWQADFDLKHIDFTRITEIVNVLHNLWSKKALLWGFGYGSWYTDDFMPFTKLNLSAFDADSIETGHFYRVHQVFFHILLKFGVLGLALYLSLYLGPALWLFRRRLFFGGTTFDRCIKVTLLSSLPIMILSFYWATKAAIIGGWFIVLLRHQGIGGFYSKKWKLSNANLQETF